MKKNMNGKQKTTMYERRIHSPYATFYFAYDRFCMCRHECVPFVEIRIFLERSKITQNVKNQREKNLFENVVLLVLSLPPGMKAIAKCSVYMKYIVRTCLTRILTLALLG